MILCSFAANVEKKVAQPESFPQFHMPRRAENAVSEVTAIVPSMHVSGLDMADSSRG